MYELRYKPSTKRWHAYRDGHYICPLHCGDPLMIEVADRHFPCNIEMDTQWYVRIGKTKFRLHPQAKYRVILLF